MKKMKTEEERTYRIPGQDLQEFLSAKSADYAILYPHLGEEGYCPGMDLLIKHEKHEHGLCKKMFTVMDVLEKMETLNFPKNIMRINALGRYKTGEVWVDDMFNIAYLYLGKLHEGKYVWKEKDVVLNLGGETSDYGEILIGHIGNAKEKKIFFNRRVFPK